MLDTQEICTLFDATLAVVGISSPTSAEYAVTQRLCEGVAKPQELKPYCWDLAAGLQDVVLTQSKGKVTGIDKRPTPGYKAEGHPVASLLNFINASKDSALFIVSDLHYFLTGAQHNPAIVRSLIATCFNLKRSAKRIVILGDNLKLPLEFEGLITELENPLPDATEIEAEMNSHITASISAAWRNGQGFRLPVDLSEEGKQRLIRSLQGLTLEEVSDALTLATLKRKRIDGETSNLISAIKKEKLKKRGVDYVSAPDVQVGGLPALTNWAATQAALLNPEARQYGLKYPNGALLVGYGGTGKSLFAKNLGISWGVEIVSLDMGKMMSSALGSSEANFRDVLKAADAMSPCILLIDELDKAFAGMNGAVGDSGTFQRMIASFLQWFNDKTSAVFVVATANRVHNFTPELLRRFNGIFFVDLPNQAARTEIWQAHLNKYQIALEAKSIETLAAESDNYTGSEINLVISECAANAYAAGKPTQVTLGELMSQLRSKPPQALGDMDEIEGLRQWARSGGARFAAVPELPKSDSGGMSSDRAPIWRDCSSEVETDL